MKALISRSSLAYMECLRFTTSFATIVGLTMVTTGFGSVERVIVNLNRENCKLT